MKRGGKTHANPKSSPADQPNVGERDRIQIGPAPDECDTLGSVVRDGTTGLSPVFPYTIELANRSGLDPSNDDHSSCRRSRNWLFRAGTSGRRRPGG